MSSLIERQEPGLFYVAQCADAGGSRRYVLDTCAGGSWTIDLTEAKQWATSQEARVELAACDINDCDVMPIVYTIKAV